MKKMMEQQEKETEASAAGESSEDTGVSYIASSKYAGTVITAP